MSKHRGAWLFVHGSLWLAAVACGADPDSAVDQPEQNDVDVISEPAGDHACPTCTTWVGGETTDFGGGPAQCGGARERLETSDARLGFSVDSLVEQLDGRHEAEMRWSDCKKTAATRVSGFVEQTTVTVVFGNEASNAELIAQGGSSLADGSRCTDYLVFTLPVTLEAADGSLHGSFNVQVRAESSDFAVLNAQVDLTELQGNLDLEAEPMRAHYGILDVRMALAGGGLRGRLTPSIAYVDDQPPYPGTPTRYSALCASWPQDGCDVDQWPVPLDQTLGGSSVDGSTVDAPTDTSARQRWHDALEQVTALGPRPSQLIFSRQPGSILEPSTISPSGELEFSWGPPREPACRVGWQPSSARKPASDSLVVFSDLTTTTSDGTANFHHEVAVTLTTATSGEFEHWRWTHIEPLRPLAEQLDLFPIQGDWADANALEVTTIGQYAPEAERFLAWGSLGYDGLDVTELSEACLQDLSHNARLETISPACSATRAPSRRFAWDNSVAP
jgi:hypothetical protein